MKTLGVIGGMGWEGSAAYYRIMNQAVRTRLGGWHSSRLILDSLDFNAIAAARSRVEFDQVRRLLVESAKRLEAAGADGILIACNTVHRFAQSIVDATSVPFLHIADAAGKALRADGHVRVGLIGTAATMHGTFYTNRLIDHYGLEVHVPNPKSCELLQHMILNELNNGTSPQTCAPRIDAIVAELAESGCTAVLLACTEFGLAYGSLDQPVVQRSLPLYDTAVIHAHAAVDFALA